MHIPRSENVRADELANLSYSQDVYHNFKLRKSTPKFLDTASDLWVLMKTESMYDIRWVEHLLTLLSEMSPCLLQDLLHLMSQELAKTCLWTYQHDIVQGLMHTS
ncbi:hypothetical protein O6H91_08G018100 [Diphasiastrum complanatum]|uniref:Uncharacterized protein n=1 Tax=Diphasiastrum complanatum TaxID=34168 RepID=A0ACC2CVF2_DIPCM|nr:hypothetical protein O6H91_08G018100 [Diphasiastrum complanatum]